MTNLEWLKSLSVDELKTVLMEVYTEDWLMEEHKKKYRVSWTIHCRGHFDVETDTPNGAILIAKVRMLDQIADDAARKAVFSAEVIAESGDKQC